MSGFSEGWLALREPYDVRARNREVLKAVATAFGKQNAINVVDLACGTGSTLRAVSLALPEHQSWRLVDNDLSLLARAKPASASSQIRVVTKPVDLVHDLEFALDGPVDLVTTSAFLDLVSDEWLERLVQELAARRLPFYAALSYDGRATMEPADRLDAAVIAAVNRHQMTDKGFGPARGPEGAAEAIRFLKSLDYKIVQGRSDWVFEPNDAEIQRQILAGWAGAARDLDDVAPDQIADWLERRDGFIAAGRATMTVGHVDFFAQPKARR